MIDIHTNGWTKKIFDANLRDCVQKTMLCTFQERFNGVVELLKVSDFSFPRIFPVSDFHCRARRRRATIS
jgi:hypothetical protein